MALFAAGVLQCGAKIGSLLWRETRSGLNQTGGSSELTENSKNISLEVGVHEPRSTKESPCPRWLKMLDNGHKM